MDKEYKVHSKGRNHHIINFLIPYVILSVALGPAHLPECVNRSTPEFREYYVRQRNTSDNITVPKT